MATEMEPVSSETMTTTASEFSLMILAENGLMLLSGYDTTVDLTLQGKRKVLMNLDPSQVRIVADTSGISAAGVQTLNYTYILPNGISPSDISVKSRSIYNITVTVLVVRTGTVTWISLVEARILSL